MDSDTSSPTSNGTKRTNQTISNEVRKLIIDTINSGEDQSVVAKMVKVKPTTVRAIYSAFKKTGQYKKKKVGHRKSILSDNQKEQICNWVDEDCTLTLKQLVAKCLTEFNISLSKSTVERALSLQLQTCLFGTNSSKHPSSNSTAIPIRHRLQSNDGRAGKDVFSGRNWSSYFLQSNIW
jgi:transposase